jgi:tetratricopeptide (TPR) repeat protein
LAGYEQALAWFTVERPVLLACVQAAADYGFGGHAWQLAAVLRTFLRRQSYWQDWFTVFSVALEAVDRCGDRVGQAHTHHGLGMGHGAMGSLDEAHVHLEKSVGLFLELGDPEEANVLLGQGVVYGRQCRYDEARHCAEKALELYRSTGDWRGQALALNNIGWYFAQLDDHGQALDHCRQALQMLQKIGDRRGEARTWDSLGYAHHRLGDHRQAIACYQSALEWKREFGDREDLAETLERLGDSHAAAGEPDPARGAWQDALDILDELGHHTADQVRAKLHRGL